MYMSAGARIAAEGTLEQASFDMETVLLEDGKRDILNYDGCRNPESSF